MNTTSVYFNQSFDKKRLKALISWIFKKFGEKEALRVVEELKTTGFYNATQAGLSIGLNDLITPPQKAFLISKAQVIMNATHQDFDGARITATERSQRIVDTWHQASETLRKEVVNHFNTYEQYNPVYMMALSGARGNFSQVRQLVGMRGLMADPQGRIISFPIQSNLREGLTLTEYFISCSGARKGVVDTALRTADTGYLTRRLVDVSHHVVVKRIVCGTSNGIVIKSLYSNNKLLLPLKDRLVGRVLAQDISLPSSGQTDQYVKTSSEESKRGSIFSLLKQKDYNLSESLTESTQLEYAQSKTDYLLAKKDQEISPDLAFRISLIKRQLLIRSPLTCALNHEVCQLCYGWSLAQGSLVTLGEAVGVIAAQSIGEPGTQLTMRTFHTGGVFSGDLLHQIRAPHSGKLSFCKAFQGLLIRTAHGRIAFLTKAPGELIITGTSHQKYTTQQDLPLYKVSPTIPKKVDTLNSITNTQAKKRVEVQETRLPFQTLTILFVRQGEEVEKNQLLAELSFFGQEGNQPVKSRQTIFAQFSGRVVESTGGTIKMKGSLNKNEEKDEESDVMRFLDPTKSAKLGSFRILSTRVGATFNPKFAPTQLKNHQQLDLQISHPISLDADSTNVKVTPSTTPNKDNPKNFLKDTLIHKDLQNLKNFTPTVPDPKEETRPLLSDPTLPEVGSGRHGTGHATQKPSTDISNHVLVENRKVSGRQYIQQQQKRRDLEIERMQAIKSKISNFDLFHLKTIAEEGDLVDSKYKTYTPS